MNMKTLVVIILIMGLFIPTLSSMATAIKNGSPILNIEQTYIVEDKGGNLYAYYNIKIINTVDNPPSTVELRFPKKFVANDTYIYFKAYDNKNNILSAKLLKEKDYISFKIDTSKLQVKNKEADFKFIMYIPLHVYQKNIFEYLFNIVKYPAANIPINYTKIRIEIPMNTKPDNLPEGLSLVPISAAGAKPEQYEVNGEFSSDKIVYSNGLPDVYTITLKDLNLPHPQVFLFSGYENITITLYPDGETYYQYIYSFKNNGLDGFAKSEKISLTKIKNTEAVYIESLLNREIKFEEAGNILYVNLPYILLSNTTLQFKALYKVKNEVKNKGLIGEDIVYNISIEPTVDFFISKAYVIVEDPAGNIIRRGTYYNITRFSDISLNGEMKTNLFSAIRRNNYIGITIYTIVLLGVAVSVYRGYMILGYKRLPIETKEFVEQLKKETMIMHELIRLEDKYLKREIKGKKYLKKRGELVKSLKKEMRETEKLKGSVKKISEYNKRASEILELTENMKSKWNELRDLEEKFLNRRISPEEYTEQRKSLLIEFHAFIRKIEGLI